MEAILQYIVDAIPHITGAIAPWVVRFAVAGVLLWLGLRIIRVINFRIDRHLEQVSAFDATTREFFERVLHAMMLVVLAVIVLGQLGVTTTSLLALLGGAALAVGLALQGTLGNLASGIMILLLRPLVVGDVVESGGISGTVLLVSLFNTEIETFDGERLVVPNRSLTENTLTNYTHNKKRRMVVPVQVAYDADLKRARDALLDLAQSHAGVLEDPAPQVWVVELADSGVNLNLRAWAPSGDSWGIRAELLQQIKERFDAEGIEIPFPQRVIRNHPSD